MIRIMLMVSVIVAGTVWAQAAMIRYRGPDGRLYFTNVPPQQSVRSGPSAAPTSMPVTLPQTLRLIRELARQYRLEPRLVQAIISVESHFDPSAVSPAGAQGLMQLMPATAQRYHVDNPLSPRANIEGGMRYLKDLLRQFPGDLRAVLAAYHAGAHAVQRYGGIPPYPATRRYVNRVMAFYGWSRVERKIYRYRTANGGILFTDTPR